MGRLRYWKLTSEDIEKSRYNPDKLLNWDIKGVLEPEDEARFIGIFWYKKGAPLNYEVVKGIAFYHNNVSDKTVKDVTKFLQNKFQGKIFTKGQRVFLKDSEEISMPKDIAKLAKELDEKFNTKSVLTLEFVDMSSEEQKDTMLPESKVLPIPASNND